MKTTIPTFVKSADRAIDIVERVARNGPLSASDIGKMTKIPLSSLSYLLATLTERGWLYQASGRTYTIGSALSQLANGAAPSRAERIHTAVLEIARVTGETVIYFERRGYDLEAIDAQRSRHPLQYIPEKGVLVPLHSFAAGKAMLSVFKRDALEKYLAESRRTKFTATTISEASRLRKEIEMTRKRGYAVSLEEHTIGVFGVACTIDEDSSISVPIPSPRYSEKSKELAVKALHDAIKSMLDDVR